MPESRTVRIGRVVRTRTVPRRALLALVSVEATLGDGSTRDVSGAGKGTSYTSSSPAVCTVSADGKVTAVGSGGCIVTAVHEGVVGAAKLAVRVSNDADGDGLPDDFEA